MKNQERILNPIKKASLLILTGTFILGCACSCQRTSLSQGIVNAQEINGNGDVNTQIQTSQNYYSYLTGEATSKDYYALRPVSFCVENSASYQPVGLSKAEILIETPCDKGSTKICVLTTLYPDVRRVGSISEIPSYLSSIASAFNSIQIYSGFSGDSVSCTNFFDSTTSNSNVFFRDASVSAPNNLMADGTEIINSAKESGFVLNQSSSYSSPFSISDFTSASEGSAAKYVTIPYLNDLKVNFSYNNSSGKYIRMQNDRIYRDGDNEELSYSNVIIMLANTTTVATHDSVTMTLDAVSGGDGYYMNGGKYIPIEWSRDQNNNLILNDKTGSGLKIGKGNSYIGLLQVSNSNQIVIGN